MFLRRSQNEEPERVISRGDTIRWGPIELPDSESTNHFLAMGTTGSGKTTLFRLLMQSVLPRVGTGDYRALVYDAKQDALPILSGIVDPSLIVTLNPFDERGAAWDLSKDLNEPRLIHQFTTTLFPLSNEVQRFFVDASRNLLYGVGLSYYLSGFTYTFADLLRPLRNIRVLEQIIRRHRETRHIASAYLSDRRLAFNIMATIQSMILPFEPVAACWEHAKRRISLRDWAEGQEILVLGNSEESRDAVDSINRCMFRRACEVTLALPESWTRRSWFFVDELADAGRLDGVRPLAKKGRSKGACLCIAFQSISGLRDPHLYSQHGTDELLGQIGNRAIGRLECPETAKWVSELIGEQEVTKRSSSSTSSSQGSSHTTNYSQQVQKAVLASQLMDITPCTVEDGLTAYYMVRSVGTFPANMSGRKLFERDLVPPAENVPEFLPREPHTQILRPWSNQQAEEFGAWPLKEPVKKGAKKKAGKKDAKGQASKRTRKRAAKPLPDSSPDPLEDLFQ